MDNETKPTHPDPNQPAVEAAMVVGSSPVEVVAVAVATEMALAVPEPENDMAKTNDNDLEDSLEVDPIAMRNVGWFSQTKALTRKNVVQVIRWKWQTITALLAPTVFVLIAFGLSRAAGGNVSPSSMPILDQCGAVSAIANLQVYGNDQMFTNNIYGPSTLLNSFWNIGGATVLSLGPAVVSIIIIVNVSNEASDRLLGVLRSLGMRESAYWSSWTLTYIVIILLNSLLAAGIAKALPDYVFEQSYYGGLFATFFFFQLAMIPFSFFTATLAGSNKKVVGWLAFLLIGGIVGMIIGVSMNVNSYGTIISGQGGATWLYQTTEKCSNYGGTIYWNSTTNTEGCEDIYSQNCRQVASNCTGGPCQEPIVASQYDQWGVQPTNPSEYFEGCFVAASGFDYWWGGYSVQKFGLAVFFMMPWFHFGKLWSVILGSVSLPGGKFTSSMIGMDVGELTQQGLLNLYAYQGSNVYPVPTASPSASPALFPAGGVITSSTLPYTYIYPKPSNNCPVLNTTCSIYTSDSCNFMAIAEPVNSLAPSFGSTLGFLVALFLIYFLVALWFAQLATMGNGVSKSFYFCFTKGFWAGKSQKVEMSENELEQMRSSLRFAITKSAKESSIQVYHLGKAFDSFQAVKDVSFSLEHGQVCVLLGHNGAGKSTLIKMLTGQISPSSGNAFIYGNSVLTDVDAVRNLMGVCPQDDMLFPSLTAKEHLELFAVMRGVPEDEVQNTVIEWLKDVNLSHVANNMVSSYSGGMKRRLSVALSTIGNTRFVVLDEPTTGMDPVNRRFVWQHIEKIKAGRMIILCTHNMDEADVVGENVIIMANGEVAARGSPLELKRQYGTALQFNLTVPPQEVDSRKTYIVGEIFKNSPQDEIAVEQAPSGGITVTLKRLEGVEQSGDLTTFLNWLQTPESQVTEYGISNSSLDEVFMNVTRGVQNQVNTTEDPLDGIQVCCECCCTCCIRCCMCCCCPKPVLKEEEELEPSPSEDALERGISERELKATNLAKIAAFKPQLWWLPQLHALFIKKALRQWTGKPSIALWICFPLFIVIGIIIFFLIGIQSTAVFIGVLICTVLITLLLPVLVSPTVEECTTGLLYVMQTQGMLGRSYLLTEVVYAWTIQFIYTLLFMTLMLMTNYFRAPFCSQTGWSQGCAWNTAIDSSSSVYATTVPGDYGQILALSFAFSCTLPGSVLLWSLVFPGQKSASVFTSIYALGAGISPIALMFLKNTNKACTDFIASCSGTDPDVFECFAFTQSTTTFLCAPPEAALFPQFGLGLMLATYFNSNVRFSAPPPAIYDCSSENCQFEFARERFNIYFGYTLLGALILIILGVGFAGLILFTPNSVKKVLHRINLQLKHTFGCQRGSNAQNLSKSAQVDEAIDEDVLAERGSVEALMQPFLNAAGEFNGKDQSRDSIPPVLVHNLSKVYPSVAGMPPKVALKDFYLHVPPGQVLGLLGANGAGKTTMLRILAGFHDSSTGTALVGGYDIATERLSVFESLGNCPQFDVVYDDMSVKHHLEFFSRLKGIPPREVKKVAHTMASAVGLGSSQAYRTLASELSGGMRRRLSLAIALLSSPNVVILDEPSTGLDPRSRHKIWDLVHLFGSQERSMIVTTHSMEEADILSNRIAIMVKGKLQVLGSSQRLKNRFGSGFLLQVNLLRRTASTEEAALAFVRREVHPEATITSRQAKTLRINLPNDERLNLGNTFRVLQSPAAGDEGLISQWLLNQASLEDVFINICEKEELNQ